MKALGGGNSQGGHSFTNIEGEGGNPETKVFGGCTIIHLVFHIHSKHNPGIKSILFFVPSLQFILHFYPFTLLSSSIFIFDFQFCFLHRPTVFSFGPFCNNFCTNCKTGFLGSRPTSRVKVDDKNYSQHFIKHDEDNDSQSKTFSKIKIIKEFFLYLNL